MALSSMMRSLRLAPQRSCRQETKSHSESFRASSGLYVATLSCVLCEDALEAVYSGKGTVEPTIKKMYLMLFQTPASLFQCTSNEEHLNYVLVIFCLTIDILKSDIVALFSFFVLCCYLIFHMCVF